MSATKHHEIHPGAEMLSAFAEQALSASERGDVLKHLAVCGRCREVVALAPATASAGVAPARHEVMRPRAWWRRWGLALAPAAAVAATAVIAVYVHERSLEKSAEVARLERRQAVEKTSALPQVPPQPPFQAAPPEAPRSTPEKTKKAERPERAGRPEMAEPPSSVAEPDETAAAPPPEVMNGLLPARGGPVVNPEFERRRKSDEALAPTGAAPGDKTPTEAGAHDEERKKHAEEEADNRRQFTAMAPISSNQDSPGSATPGSGSAGSTIPVDVSAQQLETQPAPPAGHLQLHGLRSMVDRTTGPYAFHLPDGQPAVSSASADHRMLAIDEKGTLFIREDSEGTWQKIKRQWTGRAVAVRRHASAVDTTGVVPAPETGENPATLGSLTQPETAFELVNDHGQVWISQDGRIWTAQ
jgi:putative zinc finger protein